MQMTNDFHSFFVQVLNKEMFHGLESLRVIRASKMNRLRKVEEAAFQGTPRLEALYLVQFPEF